MTKPGLNRAPVVGVILAGGQSRRMGRDKAGMDYHGRPQWLYLAEILDSLCAGVCLSLPMGVDPVSYQPWTVVEDAFPFGGPINGILSGGEKYPGKALLTVACDLPQVDRAALDKLMQQRASDCLATAYVGTDGNPEPLLALWEPAAQAELKSAAIAGERSPRRFLMKRNWHAVEPTHPGLLFNANTPTERATWQALHGGG